MVVLKKIKASTLMETLVATILIIIIFTMASLLLNSLFSNSIQGNNHKLLTHLEKLEYQYKNGIIEIPYFEELDNWNVEVVKENSGISTYLVVEAINKKTNKHIKTYSAIEK